MEINTSVSLLVSIGGIVASVAATLAIVKTKIARMEETLNAYEKRIEDIRETYSHYQADEAVKIALLESKQESHAKELAELRSDVKTIMNNVQDIKEAILTIQKGEK